MAPLCGMSADFNSALERMDVDRPEFIVYANVEDDFRSAGSFLTEAYLAYLATGPQIPPIPVNVERLFANLGLTEMTDLTVASHPRDGNGFVNQMMIRFEDRPKGLFLVSGATNEAFDIVWQAPADAEFIAEFRLSGNQLFAIVKSIVIDIMGPMGQGLIDGQLNQPVVPGGPTLAEIVAGLNTSVQFALQPYEGETPPTMPPGMEFLAGESILRIKGIAPLLTPFTPMLAGAGFAEVESADGQSWKMTLPGDQFGLPILLHTIDSSGDVFVTLKETSKNWFLDGADAPIASSDAFNSAIDGLPLNGLSFWYSSEKMSRMQIENLDSQVQIPGLGPVMSAMKTYLQRFTGPQAGVSFLEEDAYRVVNHQPASYKTNFALAATLVPVGIVAAMPPQLTDEGEEVPSVNGEVETNPSPAD